MRNYLNWFNVLAGVVGLLGLGFSLGLVFSETLEEEKLSVPNAAITAVYFDETHIDEFDGGIVVPYQLDVSGTAVDLPSHDNGLDFWICVMPPNGRIYPQQEPIDWKNEWALRDVLIGKGDPDDIGRQFSICLVAAEGRASNDLFEDATIYQRGIPCMPHGAVICDQIVVVRK
jgi:hypothetical protein